MPSNQPFVRGGRDHSGRVVLAAVTLVTLFYRCETDQRAVTLSDEHDEAEWLPAVAAGERLEHTFGVRASRMPDRAVALGSLDADHATVAPAAFTARADPYEGTEVETDEMLQHLADARESGLEELRERDD